MLCTGCYDVTKQRNSQADVRYLSAPGSPAALEKLFHRWVHEAQDRNDAHDAEFGLSEGRWGYDDERGTMTFFRQWHRAKDCRCAIGRFVFDQYQYLAVGLGR